MQLDSAGLMAIEDVAHDLMREGVTLVVARMRAATRQRFDESGLADAIGPASARRLGRSNDV